MGHLQISSSFAAGKGGVECWILKITVTYSKSISISDLLVIKPIISIVTVLQYDKNGRVGLREMTTNVHNLTNNDPDGIETTNLNLQMTYVCICKCSSKKSPRNSFYVFSDKKFTAFLGHAAKILLATKCH